MTQVLMQHAVMQVFFAALFDVGAYTMLHIGYM